MQQFLSIRDVTGLPELIQEALTLKRNATAWSDLGRDRTLGMIFMNPSLRTRLSTQKAAMNLGMNVMAMNVSQDGWNMETEDGVVMDGDAQEHIREAARVISQYCDIIGLRSFARLKDRHEDRNESFLMKFVQEATVPVINMESATGHPLQALADLMTIREYFPQGRPKVVLTWAPHPRPLPQAVANSFAHWVGSTDAELVITHPEGYELDPQFTGGGTFEPDQNRALEGADFVYAKNWSASTPYGQVLTTDPDWMITEEKMKLTNHGKFMHCLPVRRNVIVTDAVLDSSSSIVIGQAANREYATQTVLKRLLEWIG